MCVWYIALNTLPHANYVRCPTAILQTRFWDNWINAYWTIDTIGNVAKLKLRRRETLSFDFLIVKKKQLWKNTKVVELYIQTSRPAKALRCHTISTPDTIDKVHKGPCKCNTEKTIVDATKTRMFTSLQSR